MSSRAGSISSPHAVRSPAADVAFEPIASNHGESVSRTETRGGSISGRSSTSEQRDKSYFFGSSPLSGTLQNSLGTVARKAKKSGGFLLDSALVNGRSKSPDSGDRNSKRSEQNGHAQVDKRLRSSRFSGESSQRSSPLSQALSQERLSSENGAPSEQSPGQPALDPAQLVQMALSLSESRKRAPVNNLAIHTSPANSKRLTSASFEAAYGTVRTPRRMNRDRETVAFHSPSFDPSASSVDSPAKSLTNDGDVVYTFSPATLSRAEKARRYFELANEHRRLLEHLPPLQQHPASVSGTAHHDHRISLRHHSGHQESAEPLGVGLGRAYNPLQALRNRRLRNRDRRVLSAPADSWQDTTLIKKWIDDVAAGSHEPGYRSGESMVRLPHFEGEADREVLRPETAKGHRRTNTVQSVITRPENSWSIEPAELLADTYWSEQPENRAIIENRRGERIFADLSQGVPLLPRDGKGPAQHGSGVADDQHESDSDSRGHGRRKHILHISERIRRPHINRALSHTSNSSFEGRRPTGQSGNVEGSVEENIGPLERHMRQLIAKDEKGELSSPELLSPDHWDSRHTQFPITRDHTSRISHSIPTSRDGTGISTNRHRRGRSKDGQVGSPDHGMSSMDEMLSESPVSPTFSNFEQRFVVDHSPQGPLQKSPDGYRSSVERHSTSRSRSRDGAEFAPIDFGGATGTPLSPVMSNDERISPGEQHATRPERPPHRRNKTAESSSGFSLGRLNTATTSVSSSAASNTKSSGTSATRRFFKGGRIGNLVRHESSRLGDRLRGNRDRPVDQNYAASELSRNFSDLSDDDEERRVGRGYNKGGEPTDPDSQISPRGSLDASRNRPRFFTSNLPVFKSPGAREGDASAASSIADSDPISRQQKLNRARGRSPRFDRLAPPRIQLPEEDIHSDTDLMRRGTGKSYQNGRLQGHSISARTSAVELRPVSVETIVPLRKRIAIGDVPDAKRHWSISDQRAKPPVASTRIAKRDVARVQALLLASGIKAREILRQADSIRIPPSPMLIEAATICGRKDSSWMRTVPRKEEHEFAARMLSEALERDIQTFKASIQAYQSETAASLSRRLSELQGRVGDQLAALVYETADDADAFNVELTTKQPQDIKRVDDAVDAMLRQRRRQFRFIRRAGFKILELLLLSIMWWLWFIVMVVNTVRKTVVGMGKAVKWLVWF